MDSLAKPEVLSSKMASAVVNQHKQITLTSLLTARSNPDRSICQWIQIRIHYETESRFGRIEYGLCFLRHSELHCSLLLTCHTLLCFPSCLVERIIGVSVVWYLLALSWDKLFQCSSSYFLSASCAVLYLNQACIGPSFQCQCFLHRVLRPCPCSPVVKPLGRHVQ